MVHATRLWLTDEPRLLPVMQVIARRPLHVRRDLSVAPTTTHWSELRTNHSFAEYDCLLLPAAVRQLRLPDHTIPFTQPKIRLLGLTHSLGLTRPPTQPGCSYCFHRFL